MLANIISQSVLTKVIGNSEDSLPNKIKEKEESLQNTLNNRLTIPMSKTLIKEENVIGIDNTNDDKKNIIDNNQQEKHSEVVNESSKEFELFYFTDSNIIEGNEKPINVKEHMIINMNKKYARLLESRKQFEINNELKVVANEPVELEIKEEPAKINETEASHYGMPASIEKILVNTVDFDTTVVAINQTREKFKNVSEQANRAEQDAKESDRLLEKISYEYTEAERQLKEKEMKSKEIEQKILSLLNTEQDRLSQQMQEKENVIDKANKRKEENDGKIVDFKTKISSTLEKASEYDEMISKQEQLLNTLVEFNTNFERSDGKETTFNKVV